MKILDLEIFLINLQCKNLQSKDNAGHNHGLELWSNQIFRIRLKVLKIELKFETVQNSIFDS